MFKTTLFPQSLLTYPPIYIYIYDFFHLSHTPFFFKIIFLFFRAILIVINAHFKSHHTKQQFKGGKAVLTLQVFFCVLFPFILFHQYFYQVSKAEEEKQKNKRNKMWE